MFSFEKKNQKTFALLRAVLKLPEAEINKIFCFFCSQKDVLTFLRFY
jgi:hypothetical protein